VSDECPTQFTKTSTHRNLTWSFLTSLNAADFPEFSPAITRQQHMFTTHRAQNVLIIQKEFLQFILVTIMEFETESAISTRNRTESKSKSHMVTKQFFQPALVSSCTPMTPHTTAQEAPALM